MAKTLSSRCTTPPRRASAAADRHRQAGQGTTYAGIVVRRFLTILLAFMNSKITTADAKRLTSEVPHASISPVTAYKYSGRPMDHFFYEDISRSAGRRTIILGS